MLVPVLLAIMLVILLIHGFVVRRRVSHHDHGVFFDLNGSHDLTLVNSMQDFAPTPHARGFDSKHWTSVYWG